MLIIELLLISLIILTILTQSLNIRIFDREIIYLRLSLTIFSLELSLKSKEGKKPKQAETSLSYKLSYYSFLIKTLNDLAEMADVTIYRLDTYDRQTNSIPLLIFHAITTPMLLEYLAGTAHSFKASEGAIGERIDVSFDIALISVIISYLKLQYYKLRLKYKEGRKNAR